MSGTVIRYELPNALELLSRASSTGILTISRDTDIATISLVDGGVFFASSHTTPRIGDILVESGVVEQKDLEDVLRVQRRMKGARLLASMLLDMGLVSREAAELALESQITQVLQNVFSWTEGEFRFEPSDWKWGRAVAPPTREVGKYVLRVAMVQAQPNSGELEVINASVPGALL